MSLLVELVELMVRLGFDGELSRVLVAFWPLDVILVGESCDRCLLFRTHFYFKRSFTSSIYYSLHRLYLLATLL